MHIGNQFYWKDSENSIPKQQYATTTLPFPKATTAPLSDKYRVCTNTPEFGKD
jgi:hypothetical protein